MRYRNDTFPNRTCSCAEALERWFDLGSGVLSRDPGQRLLASQVRKLALLTVRIPEEPIRKLVDMILVPEAPRIECCPYMAYTTSTRGRFGI